MSYLDGVELVMAKTESSIVWDKCNVALSEQLILANNL